jgi:pyruvate dehydrogenase (quinone)
LNAPIVHALRGKEFIEYDNPFDVGMTGLLGFSSGYFAMMNCNTLLMIGTDFPYQQFFPKHATVIQIDIRGEQLGRRTKLDHGLVGDTKVTLQALLPKLKQHTDDKHLKLSLEHYRKARKALDELATQGAERRGSHPQFVAREINDLADDDAIFTCDVGTPTIWASRYLKMNGKRRLLGSFVHGSMASALPQAIGAQLSSTNAAETAKDVRPMLEQAFKHDGPALAEVPVHRQELSMPPTITLEEATGFGIFMLKAVLSGRGDEIVDLAKVNLFR